MKKIIVLVLVFVISFSNTFAFSISKFEEKKASYKIVLEEKLSKKISSFDKEKLEKLNEVVKNKIEKIENNTTISDNEKLNKLSLYYALNDFIKEKILSKTENEKYNFLVIDDKRCNNCNTDIIIEQLKLLPNFSDVKVDKKDFSDVWIEKYLKDNNITKLPAFIFKSNQINDDINKYLILLPSKEYSLMIWASFDPFVKRSEKWLSILDKEIYKKIKDESYIKGSINSKITWIEYSDLECPYCAKLHNDWTYGALKEKYSNDLNFIYIHFPLDFHKNAFSWAQILECIWELKWWDTFYKILDNSYNWRDYTNSGDNSKNSSKEFLFDEAEKLWINKDDLQKCLDDWKFDEKITNNQKQAVDIFWITWTPGNVLINNETLEYEVISWAYPKESFEEIINKLLEK